MRLAMPLRLAMAGSLLVLAMASAQAQLAPGTPGVSPGTSSSMNIGRHADSAAANGGDSDKQKVKANDKAYNAALKNLPDKQYDPWRGVR